MQQDVELNVRPGVRLDPIDEYLLPCVDREPLPWPETRPFHLDDCLARLATVGPYPQAKDWRSCVIKLGMSREEAIFWLHAIPQRQKQFTATVNFAHAGTIDWQERPTIEDTVERLTNKHGNSLTEFIAILATLYEPLEILQLAIEFMTLPTEERLWNANIIVQLIQGSWAVVRPYMTRNDLLQLENIVRPLAISEEWPTGYGNHTPIAHYLAAFVGLSEVLTPKLSALLHDTNSYPFARYYSPILALMGLEDRQLIFSLLQTVNPYLHNAIEVRACLAIMQDDPGMLAWLAYQLSETSDYYNLIAPQLLRITDPVIAVTIISMQMKGRYPDLTRQWLHVNVGSAVVGLLPHALGTTRKANAIVDYLRAVVKRGYSEVIERELAYVSAKVADRVRRVVLEQPTRIYTCFTDENRPDWLTHVLQHCPAHDHQTWIDISTLPPIIVNEHRLCDETVARMVDEVVMSAQGDKKSLFNDTPLTVAIAEHADPASTDAFALHLLERWGAERTPAEQQWILPAAARLGGPATMVKLGLFTRRWPGSGSHANIKKACQALALVGSAAAITQLLRLRQTHSNAQIRGQAETTLEQLAAQRHCTVSQLLLATVPTLGLPPESIPYSYGPRDFTMSLGDNLLPMALDLKGKRHHGLPTPRKSDDPILVNEARTAFQQTKSLAHEVLAMLRSEFELAMVFRQRWSRTDFEPWVVTHPVTSAVAQRLIWGCYSKDGRLETSFRLTAEAEIVDCSDNPLSLGDGPIGVVHPMELDAPTLSAWQQRALDYELVQPFEQLHRRTLRRDRPITQQLEGFHDKPIRFRNRSRELQQLCWSQSRTLCRQFNDVQVEVQFCSQGPDHAVLKEISFHRIVPAETKNRRSTHVPMPWDDVESVPASELFRDLSDWLL